MVCGRGQRKMQPDNMPQGLPEGVTNRQFLFAMINALANRMQTMGDGLFEEFTWKQWFALLGVNTFAEPPGIMEAAERIGTSHQNMKQLLIRLEKAGFVRLERDPLDRRRTLIRLTQENQRIAAKYALQAADFLEGMYEGISEDDIAGAASTLIRVEKNLRRLAERGREDQA